MRFQEIDENSAQQFFEMLQDAPSILEIQEQYPGVDNLMHALTAQLSMYVVLPYLEGKTGEEDLVEAFRRYLYTAFAFGLIVRENEQATRYVMDIYNKEDKNRRDEQAG